MTSYTLKDIFLKLNKGEMNQVYFLKGDDYFLQEYFIKKVEKYIFGDDASHRELLMPDDMSSQEIIDRISQADLFSSQKYFIIRNPQQIKGKAQDELLQFCFNPTPNHFLVIIIDDYYSSLKIAKELQKVLGSIDVRKPFEKELRSWTNQLFADQGIDPPPSVVQAVLDMAGDSVYHIANQVDKICLGLGEEDKLTPEFVQQFSGWNREYQKWEFLNAVGQKNLSKPLLTGNDYIFRNDMISLLPSFTALFQEMLFIHMNNGTSQPFRGYIPLTNGVKNKLSAHAKKYTKKEIETNLALLGDIDKSIKTSSENDESLLTRFLFNTLT